MSNPLNPRHWSHRTLCQLLIVLTIAGPGLARAQQPIQIDQPEPVEIEPVAPVDVRSDKTLLADPAAEPVKLNLSHVVAGAFLVVAARPAQVLTAPGAEFLPVEVLQALMEKEAGVDPLKIEQVVVSVAPPTVGPPSFSIFVQSSGPLRIKEEELAAQGGLTVTQLDGKRYLKGNSIMAPSALWLDEKSLLIAPEMSIRRLASQQAPAGADSLAVRFAAADKGDDFQAMFEMAPLRTLVDTGLAQAPIPPELASVRQLHGLIKSIELRATLFGPRTTELVISANNEDDAERLMAVFDELKRIAIENVHREISKDLQGDDPVDQAMARYQQRTTQLMYDQLRLTREGDRLVVFRIKPAESQANQLTRVAAMGFLIALLLPAVQAAREAARRNVSINNMKQIMLALLNYEATYKRFPAQANLGPDGKPLLSWRVHILPFIEQHTLYKQFHLDEPWDSEHNKQLISQMPEIFLDPSSRLAPTDGRTHYLGAAGDGRFFEAGAKDGRTMMSIRDGTTNTIAVVQVDDSRTVPWTQPEDWEMDDNNPMDGLGGLHPGGVFVTGYCDGSVKMVNAGIDVNAFKWLLTVAGGEVVNQ